MLITIGICNNETKVKQSLSLCTYQPWSKYSSIPKAHELKSQVIFYVLIGLRKAVEEADNAIPFREENELFVRSSTLELQGIVASCL